MWFVDGCSLMVVRCWLCVVGCVYCLLLLFDILIVNWCVCSLIGVFVWRLSFAVNPLVISYSLIPACLLLCVRSSVFFVACCLSVG